ncbi:B3 domain-containing protein At3g19184-like isoform X1 [Pistacia vera]|uniref:B3 domain-containing protein At3g19184-like isoform X1 n=1 Tax=Pistacia vera TaxID=55513 RepID=UPI0012632739|nr:B3 domain-containing protein At3g19184-like isoform X1 [Pistacia vera]
MVESKLTYEECRRQRLEENKKKLEELNLTKLAQALKTPTPKKSPAKRRVLKSPKSLEPVRRSSRCADKPAPNYKEDLLGPLMTIGRRSYQRRDILNRVYASHEERVYAIERAEKIQSNLDSQFPSFIKPMLQSHVTGGFWLGLPNHFCKKHLPHYDEMITLVDEEGNESQTKYLAEKAGLSGGWRGFSIDHGLVDGDAVVFHLVTPTTFEVYIVRAYESEDRDDNNEDSVDTHLGRSDKQTRSKDNKDKSNEDSDDTHKARSGKRTRSKDNKDEEEDLDGTNKGRSGKRTRASRK